MVIAEPLEDFQRTPYNSSLILGMCLKSFSSQAKSSKPNTPSFNLAEICRGWGWSENVTNALAFLATSRYGANDGPIATSRLTPFKFWMPYSSVVGGYLPKSEGIIAITLPVITVKRIAHLLLPRRDQITRRERGY